MKVPAWLLLGRSARIKSECALLDRQAREIQFFEGCRGYSRDLAPMLDCLREGTSCLAKFAIDRVMFELKSKKFEREPVEYALAGSASLGPARTNEIAQALGKLFKSGFGSHAVLIYQAGFPPQPGGNM